VSRIKLTHPYEACREEILGTSILKKFEKLGFKTIHCHETAPLTHNAVYIFSSIYDTEGFRTKSVKLDEFKSGTIDLAIPRLWKKYGVLSASLDMAEQHEDFRKAVDMKTVPIVYNETEIDEKGEHGVHNKGFYDPSNNILFLADITHNHKRPKGIEATVKRVDWLLDQLIAYQANNANAVEHAQKEIGEAITSFVMGSDIEFEVFDGDMVVGADRFYPSMHEEIGRDGHRETGEIRPKPSKDPIELAKNTESLLKKVHDHLPKGYKICGGSGMRFPIGLHIHFSNLGRDKKLIEKLGWLMNDPLIPYQTKARTDAGFGRTTDTRDQPHGWEWRALWATIQDYDMVESVFCVAYGIAKAHILNIDLGTSRVRAYSKLPNYDKHKAQIDHFVKLFIKNKFKPIDGMDIRPNWFDYMPENYEVRRYKFMDDDRMEWLYSGLEEKGFKNLSCNWILICVLNDYNAPDIVTLGVPKAILQKTVKDLDSELRFALGTEKISYRELCFAISLPVAKRAVVDMPYRRHIIGIVAYIIQSTIDSYKNLSEEGKNPVRCNTFTRVWVPDKLSRLNYKTNTYDLLDSKAEELPDLNEMTDKELAVLASLYKDDPDAVRLILETIENRKSRYKLRVRGQYDR
jgi:hypothetical protein